MNHFKCTLKSGLNLLIIPDTDAHVNGHVALTWTYSIYVNEDLLEGDLSNNNQEAIKLENFRLKEKEDNLHLEKKLDASYLGFITIEEEDKRMFYTADSEEEIPDFNVEEVIEKILHYRKNSQLWKY